MENTADDQVIQKKVTEDSDLSRGSHKGEIILPDLDDPINIEENPTHPKDEEKSISLNGQPD